MNHTEHRIWNVIITVNALLFVDMLFIISMLNQQKILDSPFTWFKCFSSVGKPHIQFVNVIITKINKRLVHILDFAVMI